MVSFRRMNRRIDWISTFRRWFSCFRWIFPLALYSVSDVFNSNSLPTVCASKINSIQILQIYLPIVLHDKQTRRYIHFASYFIKKTTFKSPDCCDEIFPMTFAFLSQEKKLLLRKENFIYYFISKWAKARVRYTCTCTSFDVDLNLSIRQIRHMAVNWKYHTFPSIDFASAIHSA